MLRLFVLQVLLLPALVSHKRQVIDGTVKSVEFGNFCLNEGAIYEP